jgi:hypothetical protein
MRSFASCRENVELFFRRGIVNADDIFHTRSGDLTKPCTGKIWPSKMPIWRISRLTRARAKRLLEKGITIPSQPRVLRELQQNLARGVASQA